MGLVSLCPNAKCWQRRQCFRWMQARRVGDICTQILPPTPEDGEPCDCFVAIMPGDRLRQDAE